MFDGMILSDSIFFMSVVVGFVTITSWAAWIIAAATAWLVLNKSRVWAPVGLAGTVGVVSSSQGFVSHLDLMAISLVPIALVFALQVMLLSFVIAKLPMSKGEAE
jgi:hypothetical protein